MPNYYVDDRPQPAGEHEVHRAGCVHLPYVESKTSLGYRHNCEEGVLAARKYHRKVNGCRVCCPDCHRSREDINS